MKTIVAVLFIVVFLSCQQDKGRKRRVFDSARLVEDTLENKLEDRLYNYAKKGNEIYVLTILSKEFYSENYEDSIFQVLNDDRINSLLIFLSYEDRFIRIMTNSEARKNISDSSCKVVIDHMTPYFSSGKYGEGIRQGIDLISLNFDRK